MSCNNYYKKMYYFKELCEALDLKEYDEIISFLKKNAFPITTGYMATSSIKIAIKVLEKEIYKRSDDYRKISEKKNNNMLINYESGDNTKFLENAIEMWSLEPIDVNDPKQVEMRVRWYFNHCITNDMKPTVAGMCFSIGVERSTITLCVLNMFIIKLALYIITSLFLLSLFSK